MTTKSQGDRILADLKRGRSIDPLTALRRYGCARLAARICELRQASYRIISERRKVKGGAVVAVYRLAA